MECYGLFEEGRPNMNDIKVIVDMGSVSGPKIMVTYNDKSDTIICRFCLDFALKVINGFVVLIFMTGVYWKLVSFSCDETRANST